MKTEITRQLTMKEFKEESEGKHKFFRIKYRQYNHIIPVTREYQQKINIERILQSPATLEAKIWVTEMVDNG